MQGKAKVLSQENLWIFSCIALRVAVVVNYLEECSH